jgi:Fe-Mn family superoxide dismutase
VANAECLYLVTPNIISMKKRDFLKLTGMASAGIMINPLIGCNSAPPANEETPKADAAGIVAGTAAVFTLPELGYATNALEPAVDQMTMEIHHGKHHAGYVRKLNAALAENATYFDMDIEQIVSNVKADDLGVRNNGGGHFNHSMYWKVMAPGGGNAPTGTLASAITSSFGSQEAFSEAFFKAAKTRFGSGWAWLCVGADQKLFVTSTANQDNPLMANIDVEHGTPILGIDVWEHAYYLNYQNRRGDYIKAFTEAINWDQVALNFAG